MFKTIITTALFTSLTCVALFYNNFNADNKFTERKGISIAQSINGVFLYVRATPVQDNYKKLGAINETTLGRALEAAKGKKKIGKVF